MQFKLQLIPLIFCSCLCFGKQKSISITIDDVPNTTKYQKDGYHSLLLNVMDALDAPLTIFINEDKILQTEQVERNKAIF